MAEGPHTRTIHRLAVVAVLLAAAFAACGGSSSETPWPVEPVDREPAPVGEELPNSNEIDVDKLPDNYSKPDAGSEAPRNK